MKRVLVYVAHLSLGARSGLRADTSSGSPSIDTAPTIPADSGPKRTAAKRIGKTEIESSVVRVSLTLVRSATAAETPRTTTVMGSLSPYPAARSPIAVRHAAVSSDAT